MYRVYVRHKAVLQDYGFYLVPTGEMKPKRKQIGWADVAEFKPTRRNIFIETGTCVMERERER
jgi:hypothetical protein